MTGGLARAVKVMPGEVRQVTTLGVLLLLNALAMQISYVSSISGFLEFGGPEGILLVWIVDFAIIAAFTSAQSLIVDRFDRGRLVTAIALAFAGAFLILRLMFALNAPPAVSYALLYILAEQQWLFFPLVFWTFANDHFSAAQATRVFPVIASWGFVGQVLGLGAAAAVPLALGALNANHNEVLTFNALIYLAVAAVLVFVMRRPALPTRKARPEGIKASLREGLEFVRDIPAFRYLAIAIIGLAVCETIVEFRFLTATGESFSTIGEYQAFYGVYRLATTLAAFALQLFVTARIIAWLSLKNSFYLAPGAFLASAATMLLAPGLGGSTAAMSGLKITRDTVDEASRKALQNVVPEERRGRVSMFLDSHLLAAGTIAGCLLTLAIIGLARLAGAQSATIAYLVPAVLASAAALWAVRKMTQTYDASMLNWRLRRRQRASSILDKLDF